jgi:hypothetical protein
MNINEKNLKEYFNKYIYKSKEEFSKFVQHSMLLPYALGEEKFKEYIQELNNQDVVAP